MDERTSVIVVDDDKTLSIMLKEAFSSQGYLCEVTSSAEAALSAMANATFDVMLTDISLPGMKGLELAQKAKKLNPKMAIIIMTGYIDDFSYDNAIESGASDFIRKPFTVKEIIIRFKHVIHQEKLRILSITDELTGLSNRRGFYTLATQQLKLSRRQKKGIYMLYADLDDLKMINDTWGHQVGDQALIETANILKTTYRESDIVARIGGDEFAVIPIGSTGDNIEIITGRLKKNLEEYNAKRTREYELSLSVGIAYYDPDEPCSIDELLSRGDRLMYEKKKLKQKS